MSTSLPAWANDLRNRYMAGEASLFLLHGNVRDLHAWVEEDGTLSYGDLRTFLERFLDRTRDVIAYYNVSQGLQFTKPSHKHLFRSIVDGKRTARGAEKMGRFPATAAEAIPVVEDLITDGAHSSAVVVDFFEMIAPNADVAFMVHEDKANLVSLQRWSTDPAFLATDNLAATQGYSGTMTQPAYDAAYTGAGDMNLPFALNGAVANDNLPLTPPVPFARADHPTRIELTSMLNNGVTPLSVEIFTRVASKLS